MYNTQTTIHMTPDQLGELIEMRVNKALANLRPASEQAVALPDYLTRKETARLLRISLVTLHKLTGEGVLQSLRIQGQIRYQRDEVAKAMEVVKNDKTKR